MDFDSEVLEKEDGMYYESFQDIAKLVILSDYIMMYNDEVLPTFV